MSRTEITVRPFMLEPDVLLDALLVCEPHVVARIMDAARAGDVTCRDGVVYWIASSKPPLPVLGVASFDPRTRDAVTFEKIVAAATK